MSWEIAAISALLYQYGLVQIAVKKIGSVEGSRTRKLVWQFFFASCLALIIAEINGQVKTDRFFLIVTIIGMGNAFGCYCHWRAYNISMARTAVLSNIDDFLAILLGYIILDEFRILSPTLATGIILSLVCVSLYAKVKNPKDKSSIGLGGWVTGYSLVWGVALFSMRYFSVHGMHILTFVLAWYSGSWLGALIMRYLIMGLTEAGPPLTKIQLGKIMFLSILVLTSLLFAYWVRMMTPITVIQPIQLVAEMSIPAFIALYLFKEAKSITRLEKSLIFSGLAGVALMAICY